MKFRTILKVIAGTISAVILLVLATAYFLTAELCGNTLLSDSVSPNGRLKVVVFRRDCGATTGFSTHVSVLNSWEHLTRDMGANVYSEKEHNLKAVAANWENDYTLKITHEKDAEVYTTIDHLLVLPFFQIVRVTYQVAGVSR